MVQFRGSYFVLLDRRLHGQVPERRRRLPARRDLRLGPVREKIMADEFTYKGFIIANNSIFENICLYAYQFKGRFLSNQQNAPQIIHLEFPGYKPGF